MFDTVFGTSVAQSHLDLTDIGTNTHDQIDTHIAAAVLGPTSGSATDNAIPRWDGTDGRLVQDSYVLIGDAGRITQTGLGDSVFIGTLAGEDDDLGNSNIAIGHWAMKEVISSSQNIAIGKQSFQVGTTQANNTGIGFQTGTFTTGNNNTAVGMQALFNVAAGANNVAVGSGTLMSSGGATATDNTILGFQAGQITSGDGNVFIGARAGNSTTSGDNNILIGTDTDTSGATASDELNIGDLITGDISVGNVETVGVFGVGQFATGALPSASSFGGYLAYNTTLDAPVYSDGVTWGSIGTHGFTEGSVIYTSASGAAAESPTKFFYDGVNDTLSIGTSATDTSVILYVSSSDRGVLLPRMTTAEKVAISPSLTGNLLFDTDLNTFNFWNGSTWTGFTGIVTAVEACHIWTHATDFTTGVSSSTAYKTIPLVTLKGDCSFVTISSNQATMDAGTYEIEVTVGAWDNVSAVSARVQNISDTATEEECITVTYNGTAATTAAIIPFSRCLAHVTLASSKILEFQSKAQASNPSGERRQPVIIRKVD